MIDRYKHQQLQIGSVSTQKISAWATKILPNGEIVGDLLSTMFVGTHLCFYTYVGSKYGIMCLLFFFSYLRGMLNDF